MPADWTIKQGDTLPLLTDTLTLSNGTVPNFNGATLQFIMRSLANTLPLTLTGTPVFTNVATGAVMYTPTAADTATAGYYMANWLVTFPSGATMTWPTAGYLWVTIEESLGLGAPAIVSLPDVKDYLNGFGFGAGTDRSRDAKLVRFINAATPIVENMVGPIIVRTFDEWYDGGQYFIQLRRRPSSALGTNPVLNVMGVDEYRGPIKYALSIIADPTQASIYSVMLDPKVGTLFRRTTGGGVIAFGSGPWGGGMPQAVHVVYQAGQQTVPENLRIATLEAIREMYETTQPVGMGTRTIADEEDRGMVPGFASVLNKHVRSAIGPMKRRIGIA